MEVSQYLHVQLYKKHINDISSIKSNTGVGLHNEKKTEKGARSIYIEGLQHKMNSYMVQALVASSKYPHFSSHPLSPCSVTLDSPSLVNSLPFFSPGRRFLSEKSTRDCSDAKTVAIRLNIFFYPPHFLSLSLCPH